MENVVIRYMIDFRQILVNIHGNIPEELYNRLIEKKPRTKEEDKKIREKTIKKLYDIRSDEGQE